MVVETAEGLCINDILMSTITIRLHDSPNTASHYLSRALPPACPPTPDTHLLILLIVSLSCTFTRFTQYLVMSPLKHSRSCLPSQHFPSSVHRLLFRRLPACLPSPPTQSTPTTCPRHLASLHITLASQYLARPVHSLPSQLPA